MIGPVYPTTPYIKGLNCNPAVDRKIIFQSCNLDIKEGSKILSQVPLCDFKIEGISDSGGSIKRSFTIKKKGNQIITAPEIGQKQGEVQMIVIKVKYQNAHPVYDRYLTWEYKGTTYPLGTLMVLTGRTLPNTPYHGWDLSDYTNNLPSPPYSPQIQNTPTSPDMSFGGIMISNPSTYDVDIEILILN
jgi:hypothetical protein